ncbi:MAG: FAD-dependent oxidoreductase [Pseudomonadota bacterium]
MSVPDVLVVGAGVFGLSIALAARRAGLCVRVLEASHPGAGASGGIVGALTPHAPSRWRPMMAFQFRALLSMSDHVERLERETGLRVGYRRSGRVTPLVSEKSRAAAERDVEASPRKWGDAARFEILDAVPSELAGWIQPEAAPFGVVRDTVSARIDPRAYIRALAAAVGDDLICGARATWFDPETARVESSAGTFCADNLVLAGGASAWPLIRNRREDLAGSAVKGQAALVAADAVHLPVLYQDGLYVIPHSGGRIAVGSTSEKIFDRAEETDERLDALLDRARTMCPALATAAVTERWAGVRPKPPGREPLVGPWPAAPRTWLATGGFKISFGIAHAVADAVVAGIAGCPAPIPLPETFDPGARS